MYLGHFYNETCNFSIVSKTIPLDVTPKHANFEHACANYFSACNFDVLKY